MANGAHLVLNVVDKARYNANLITMQDKLRIVYSCHRNEVSTPWMVK